MISKHSRRRIPDERMIEHFWSKVDRDGTVPAHRPEIGPCWVWTGYVKPNGYANFYVHRNMVYAHRFAYEITYGQIARSLCVLHKCDNRRCVCPEHLFTGTHQDNTDDAVAKGRVPIGENVSQARLSNLQVAALRALMELKGMPRGTERRLIAQAVGITPSYLNEILANTKRRAG